MIQASDFGAITTTLPTREAARRLADILLSERLAACVQLLEVESRYVWKEKPMAKPEVMLLAKTRVEVFERAIARIKALHPYETPEIVAAAFRAGFGPYLAWLASETG
ncbi:MAG: divalent-cation tolerance protein CutA [Rhizomicrobium sp.]